MKTPLEVLHKYFHHFKSERTRDLVVKAMEDYAKIYHDSEVKKLNIPAVIKSLPEPDEIRMKARELDEKDFAQWMYEIQKGNVL